MYVRMYHELLMCAACTYVRMYVCMVCGWEAGLCVHVVCQYGVRLLVNSIRMLHTCIHTYVHTYVHTVFSIKICHPKCLENFWHFMIIRIRMNKMAEGDKHLDYTDKH